MRTKSIVKKIPLSSPSASSSETLKKISRTRTTNFTPSDRTNLLELIKPYADILSNKNTDKPTCDRKQNAWQEISAAYNSKAAVKRSVIQLKLCFEAIKYKERRNCPVAVAPPLGGSKVDDTIKIADIKEEPIIADYLASSSCCATNANSVSSSARSSLSTDFLPNVIVNYKLIVISLCLKLFCLFSEIHQRNGYSDNASNSFATIARWIDADDHHQSTIGPKIKLFCLLLWRHGDGVDGSISIYCCYATGRFSFD